jgi:hypothetical protein
MASALETFRAQQEAANGIYERLLEASALLGQLRTQAEALARNEELKRLLEREESWLLQAQRTVVEVRHWREREAQRFWPGVARRWAVALAFAMASAAAGGAGYASWTKPYAAELAALRSRAGFGDLVEHRVLTMTPAERRQFETLMKWKPPRP